MDQAGNVALLGQVMVGAIRHVDRGQHQKSSLSGHLDSAATPEKTSKKTGREESTGTEPEAGAGVLSTK